MHSKTRFAFQHTSDITIEPFDLCFLGMGERMYSPYKQGLTKASIIFIDLVVASKLCQFFWRLLIEWKFVLVEYKHFRDERKSMMIFYIFRRIRFQQRST